MHGIIGHDAATPLTIMKHLLRVTAAVTALLLLAAAGIYASEARKEVIFLCGNFDPGVTLSSVRRQLGTAHFLNVRESRTERGITIEVDSTVGLYLDRCTIEFGSDTTVVSTRLD